jgi:hypothetical protein
MSVNRYTFPSLGGSPESPSEGLREHRHELLTGRVPLDNGRFVGCRFMNARLVYGGLGGVQLEDCSFHEVEFEFVGPAANTLAFLQAMSRSHSGLRDVFKASFAHIFGH